MSQLVLCKLEGSGHGLCHAVSCRLDPASTLHGASMDERGVLHYFHTDTATRATRELLCFQMQHQAPPAAAGGPFQAVQRPWAFEFVPGQPGDLLLVQQGSPHILYASLPRCADSSSDVFLVGRHTAPVTSIATNGSVAVSGCRNGRIKLWRLADGQQAAEHCEPAGVAVTAICFVGNGLPQVAAGTSAGSVVLLDISHGRLLPVERFMAGPGPVSSLATWLDPDTTQRQQALLAAASTSGWLRVYRSDPAAAAGSAGLLPGLGSWQLLHSSSGDTDSWQGRSITGVAIAPGGDVLAVAACQADLLGTDAVAVALARQQPGTISLYRITEPGTGSSHGQQGPTLQQQQAEDEDEEAAGVQQQQPLELLHQWRLKSAPVGVLALPGSHLQLMTRRGQLSPYEDVQLLVMPALGSALVLTAAVALPAGEQPAQAPATAASLPSQDAPPPPSAAAAFDPAAAGGIGGPSDSQLGDWAAVRAAVEEAQAAAEQLQLAAGLAAGGASRQQQQGVSGGWSSSAGDEEPEQPDAGLAHLSGSSQAAGAAALQGSGSSSARPAAAPGAAAAEAAAGELAATAGAASGVAAALLPGAQPAAAGADGAGEASGFSIALPSTLPGLRSWMSRSAALMRGIDPDRPEAATVDLGLLVQEAAAIEQQPPRQQQLSGLAAGGAGAELGGTEGHEQQQQQQADEEQGGQQAAGEEEEEEEELPCASSFQHLASSQQSPSEDPAAAAAAAGAGGFVPAFAAALAGLSTTAGAAAGPAEAGAADSGAAARSHSAAAAAARNAAEEEENDDDDVEPRHVPAALLQQAGWTAGSVPAAPPISRGRGMQQQQQQQASAMRGRVSAVVSSSSSSSRAWDEGAAAAAAAGTAESSHGSPAHQVAEQQQLLQHHEQQQQQQQQQHRPVPPHNQHQRADGNSSCRPAAGGNAARAAGAVNCGGAAAGGPAAPDADVHAAAYSSLLLAQKIEAAGQPPCVRIDPAAPAVLKVAAQLARLDVAPHEQLFGGLPAIDDGLTTPTRRQKLVPKQVDASWLASRRRQQPRLAPLFSPELGLQSVAPQVLLLPAWPTPQALVQAMVFGGQPQC